MSAYWQPGGNIRNAALTIIATALATAAQAVEYIGAEQLTFQDGSQEVGIYYQDHGVLVTWTSKATPSGPVAGFSIQHRTDIKSRKQIKGEMAAASYPVFGAVFEPEIPSMMTAGKSAQVAAALGTTEAQANTLLATIKADAMKRIKP